MNIRIAKVAFENPFEALTSDRLSDPGMVALVRELQAKGLEIIEGTYNEADDVALRLQEAAIRKLDFAILMLNFI